MNKLHWSDLTFPPINLYTVPFQLIENNREFLHRREHYKQQSNVRLIEELYIKRSIGAAKETRTPTRDLEEL